MCDFVEGVENTFGPISDYTEDELKVMVAKEPLFFETLNPMDGYKDLIQEARKYTNNLAVLTSVGKVDPYGIASQKRKWLHLFVERELGIRLEMFYVHTSKEKASFARQVKTLLIDDREKSVKPFREAGGLALLYKTPKQAKLFFEYVFNKQVDAII